MAILCCYNHSGGPAALWKQDQSLHIKQQRIKIGFGYIFYFYPPLNKHNSKIKKHIRHITTDLRDKNRRVKYKLYLVYSVKST